MGEGTYLACDFATYRVVVNGRHGTRVRSPRELVTAATRTQLRRFWRGLGEPPVADGSMITMANAIFNWAMEAHKPKREEGQVAKAKKKSAKKAGKVKAKKVAPKKEKKERKGRAHNFTRPKNFKDKLEKLTPQGKLCFAAVMAGRKEGETFELSKDEVMAKLKAENIKTTGDLWRNFCWHKSDARGKKLGFC